MGESPKALSMLARHGAEYQAMLTLGLEQQRCIEREDLAGVEALLVPLHRSMEWLRRHPLGGEELDCAVPELAVQGAALRELVLKVEARCRQNQQALQLVLARTRKEIRRLDRGKQAASGYATAEPAQARLYDGVR